MSTPIVPADIFAINAMPTGIHPKIVGNAQLIQSLMKRSRCRQIFGICISRIHIGSNLFALSRWDLLNKLLGAVFSPTFIDKVTRVAKQNVKLVQITQPNVKSTPTSRGIAPDRPELGRSQRAIARFHHHWQFLAN